MNWAVFPENPYAEALTPKEMGPLRGNYSGLDELNYVGFSWRD